MEPVRYFVPTRGRVGEQVTVRNFPASLRKLLTIVCPEDEREQHERDWPEVRVVAQPSDVKTIGAKREFIYRELALDCEWAWQLDDDLRFKVVVDGLFKKPVGDWGYQLQAIQTRPNVHNTISVLGLGTSYMAPKGGWREDYHLGFAFGFSRFARARLEMNRLDVFEDIDYTLQMLRGGFKIAVSYDVVVDQVRADAPGGVTGERTLETIERDFQRLCDFHPGIVQRKERRPGAHPAAITRVSWAKAAKEGGLR